LTYSAFILTVWGRRYIDGVRGTKSGDDGTGYGLGIINEYLLFTIQNVDKCDTYSFRPPSSVMEHVAKMRTKNTHLHYHTDCWISAINKTTTYLCIFSAVRLRTKYSLLLNWV